MTPPLEPHIGCLPTFPVGSVATSGGPANGAGINREAAAWSGGGHCRGQIVGRCCCALTRHARHQHRQEPSQVRTCSSSRLYAYTRLPDLNPGATQWCAYPAHEVKVQGIRQLAVLQDGAGICEAEEVLGAGPWGFAPLPGVLHAVQGWLLAPG